MLLSEVHPRNASGAFSVISSISANEPLSAYFCREISVRRAGRVIEVSAVQFINALFPIVSEGLPAPAFSNTTETRLSQFANASASMAVTLAGIMILSSLLPAKAARGIICTPSGMV